MVRENLKIMIGKLYQYFNYQKLPDSSQVDIWYEDLKYIPDIAIDNIFNKLKENDSIPRNLPKSIKGIYANMPNHSRPVQYDEYDDPRFPMEHLYTALGILSNRGNDEFIKYCRSVKMPSQDIERVRNKYNCTYDINELVQEIG